MFLRSLLLSTPLALLLSASALAQTTPVPHSDHEGHSHAPDHATAPKPFDIPLAGTYNELDGEHVLGKKNAPVTLIIYASVMCPHCADWFTSTWPDVKKNYVDTGKVRIVFREFITAPGQLTVMGFQIANCAPENKYFSILEHQMREQENIIQSMKDGKGLETYLAIAKKADLNSQKEMETCFSNEEGIAKIELSMKLAESGGLANVPNFIINGETFKGRSDYLPMSKHFEMLLNQKSSLIPK
ncbi:MAG: hypothetical protein COA43_09535 [Robiginitomaculum sp.]|nr:MAG: hypothetical protein COA43_09535 [Robiginitomaculum sp.]